MIISLSWEDNPIIMPWSNVDSKECVLKTWISKKQAATGDVVSCCRLVLSALLPVFCGQKARFDGKVYICKAEFDRKV